MEEKRRKTYMHNGIPGIWSRYSYIVVFIIIFAIYAVSNNGLTWNGTMNIFRHSAVIGIIAFGMGLICLTGEIDLSVGSMLALTSGLSVVVFNQTESIFVTLLFAIVFGTICGIINGIMVGCFEMPAFIVTLATMLIYRSLAQYICQHIPKYLCGDGSSVYRISSGIENSKIFYNIGNGKIGTIPYVGIILLGMTVFLVYLAENTKYGRKIYAVGSNQKGALLMGIHVGIIKISVFGIAGMLVGLASFMWIAINASCDPATTGISYEMYAIAAVVLGGISMSGGKGKYLGILFGAMSYTVIDKIIVALKMDSLINNTIKGTILILVILIQVMGPKLKERIRK